ncbi:hypothetical protein K469DRAFT_692189 [Zopfia rhizophila CBS 207.26]|uniref:Uncharacterized protein n=1 Tax=Zopfia rhizophila CBS 207.26 TaxID=1314779 RepID=A0A6A6DQS4_9PEZI|nr:hypothetical protein K469DRAFT_692189 [Zopfia rhizophila CBS 207.26]
MNRSSSEPRNRAVDEDISEYEFSESDTSGNECIVKAEKFSRRDTPPINVHYSESEEDREDKESVLAVPTHLSGQPDLPPNPVSNALIAYNDSTSSAPQTAEQGGEARLYKKLLEMKENRGNYRKLGEPIGETSNNRKSSEIRFALENYLRPDINMFIVCHRFLAAYI